MRKWPRKNRHDSCYAALDKTSGKALQIALHRTHPMSDSFFHFRGTAYPSCCTRRYSGRVEEVVSPTTPLFFFLTRASTSAVPLTSHYSVKLHPAEQTDGRMLPPFHLSQRQRYMPQCCPVATEAPWAPLAQRWLLLLLQ